MIALDAEPKHYPSLAGPRKNWLLVLCSEHLMNSQKLCVERVSFEAHEYLEELIKRGDQGPLFHLFLPFSLHCHEHPWSFINFLLGLSLSAQTHSSLCRLLGLSHIFRKSCRSSWILTPVAFKYYRTLVVDAERSASGIFWLLFLVKLQWIISLIFCKADFNTLFFFNGKKEISKRYEGVIGNIWECQGWVGGVSQVGEC